MPFTFKLSKRLALTKIKISVLAAAAVALACARDLTSPHTPLGSPAQDINSATVTPLAVTTVVASGYQDPNVPKNTRDGSLATRWSAYGDGQWISYDLGQPMAVGSVNIAWYCGDQWVSAFEIQASPNATTWATVFSGRSSGQTLQPESYTFPAVTARYFRIVGHGQWSGTTQLSLWNSITEVAIAGGTALATNAVAPAAVSASGYQDANAPPNTLDDNLATRWSAYGDGQWISYDLGQLMVVGSVSIAWYCGNQWASAFAIQVSQDTATWTTVFRGRSGGQTLQPESYSFPAITARYVRVVGHGQWSGSTELSLWNSITEVTVSASVTLGTNAVAAAGVSASTYQNPNAPANTLDGNLATRWSAQGDGQWIGYDLGQPMTVGAVDIAWYCGNQWVSAFDIRVSPDGTTWATVFSGRSGGLTLQAEHYTFPAMTGRYVRIVGHGQWSRTTELSLWNSITAVAIYGSLTTSTTMTTPTAAVASVTLSPASASVSVGQTVQLVARLQGASGNQLTGQTVTWASSAPAVAKVTGGLVTGVGVGSATITATGGGVTGSAPLTVTVTEPVPGATDTIIMQDGFESGDLSQWAQLPNNGRYSITTDPTRAASGGHALQVLFTPTNTYGMLTRWFMPGYDEIYVKFRVLFMANFDESYGLHFVTIAGNRIDDSTTSFGKPAIVPNGTDYFYAGVDPEFINGDALLKPLHFYTYWPDMSCCYGNRFYQTDPKIALVPGQWQEVVVHIKLNTPGQSDGSQELWINGVEQISVQNMRWRTTTDLRLNELRFDDYMSQGPTTEYLWLDDITVWRP